MNNKLISKSFSRYVAIQALYNSTYSDNLEKIINYFLSKNELKLYIDFKNQHDESNINKKFLDELLKTFSHQKVFIDKLINSNLDNSWSFERMPKVLLSILRVAVSEMIVSQNISLGIIATEYIMFTESFFTQKECSFTNAILEKIFLKLKQNNFNE